MPLSGEPPGPAPRPAAAARRPGVGDGVGGDRPAVRGGGPRPARTHLLRRGHHYALVLVEGLEPGSTTRTRSGSTGSGCGRTQSARSRRAAIRTPGRPGPFRIAVRFVPVRDAQHRRRRHGIPPDALDTYAAGVAGLPEDAVARRRWCCSATRCTRTSSRRARSGGWRCAAGPRQPDRARRTANFEEYTRLYAESWSDPQVRWLLSTVPSSMIFDDHEMIDDWNTSAAWRREVTGEDWWPERITGGLASYWVYQHLGNLSPAGAGDEQDLAGDQGLGRGRPDDAEPMLREMAARPPTPSRAPMRWSYVRHWGDVRMVMVDSRAGRVLDEQDGRWSTRRSSPGSRPRCARRRRGRRASRDRHLAAVAAAARDPRDRALERDAQPARHVGRPLGRAVEKLRQAADLEHWSAFGDSFERLGTALVSSPAASTGRPPATALVLSGDVHHAYAAELVQPGGPDHRVHQLTVSPLHNQAPHPIRVGLPDRLEPLGAAVHRRHRAPGPGDRTPAASGRRRPARTSATRSASWCSTAGRRGSGCPSPSATGRARTLHEVAGPAAVRARRRRR